jgi:replicative DNA helicase
MSDVSAPAARYDYSKIGDEGEVVALPLSDAAQYAVLGWMEEDERFSRKMLELVRSDWFVNADAGLAFNFMKRWDDKYHSHPNPPEPSEGVEAPGDLLQWGEFLLLTEREKKRFKVTMMKAREHRLHFTRELITNQLETWLKTRHYLTLVDQSGKKFNAGKFEECWKDVSDNLQKMQHATFGIGQEANFEPAAIVMEERAEYRDALTFGVNDVDGALLKAANGRPDIGGLLPGDTTILLAPVNVGKTTCMVSVAVANILNHKKVLLVSHEGREHDIKMKIWCSLMLLNEEQFMSTYDDPDSRDSLMQKLKLLKEFLVYVPMNRSGGTVEETVRMVRNLYDQHGFHMYIDDYPGTLTTEQALGGKLTRRERDDIVYGQMVDLAGELKFHTLCAIQSNREGSKINRRISEQDKHRLLTMEDASESFGPMMRATNVITINRDPKAVARNVVQFNICKSRSGETGWVVSCTSRYDLARTHGESLCGDYGFGRPHASFRTKVTASYSDTAEGFLARPKFPGSNVVDAVDFHRAVANKDDREPIITPQDRVALAAPVAVAG